MLVLGNTNQWKTRIAKGTATLYDHALPGYKAMPPKGTCMSCTEDDVRKIVDYMIKVSN